MTTPAGDTGLPLSEQDKRWLDQHYKTLLRAAMAADADAVATAFSAIDDAYGQFGIYLISCGLAELIRGLVFPDFQRGDGTLTGDFAAIEMPAEVMRRQPNRLWAHQFTAAYMNGDMATTSALFFGPLVEGGENNDEVVAGVLALLSIAAGISRRKGVILQ